MRLYNETGCMEALNIYSCSDMIDATNHSRLRRSRHLLLVYHDDERRPAGYGVEQQAVRLAYMQHNQITSHIRSLLMKERA